MPVHIAELISQMTLEEKAGLCSGADFWHTKAVGRLGIPAMMVSDGPHGLRTQEEGKGINDSIKAVCFPAGCASAASFDVDLLRRLGETIGAEAKAVGLGVVLGPALNIKRSPLCAATLNIIPRTRPLRANCPPLLSTAYRARAWAPRPSISRPTTRRPAA